MWAKEELEVLNDKGVIMGGNATKQFGSQRISKEMYVKISSMLSDILLWNTEWQCNSRLNLFKFCPIPYVADKESFGDMDIAVLASKYIDLSAKSVELAVNEYSVINSQELAKVIGWVKNDNTISIAMQFFIDAQWTAPFQVDFIVFSDEATYDFARHYFSYNDLGNLIGVVAKKYGLKFGFDGLFVQSYFDEKGRLSDKHHSQHKVEQKITSDFEKALQILGYDVARFKQGFASIEEVVKYAASSPLFHPEMFKDSERSSESLRRDKKRPTYKKARECFEQLSAEPPLAIHAQNWSFALFKKYPQLHQAQVKSRKQVRSIIMSKRRFSATQIQKIAYSAYHLTLDMVEADKLRGKIKSLDHTEMAKMTRWAVRQYITAQIGLNLLEGR